MKTITRVLNFSLILSLIFVGSMFVGNQPILADNTQPAATNSGAGVNSSYNWAGYVADSGTYTSVTGSWTVPTVTASGNFSADATWVGIGGVKTQDLIQAGTQAIVESGAVTYQAWYETIPNVSTDIPMTVKAGDSITATLTEGANQQWTVSLSDNTNGQNFQTVLPYNSSLSSAEWVQEMPSESTGGFIPLDNFGSVNFSNGYTTYNGNLVNISSSGAQSINMVTSQDQALATPSALGSDGASFTVTRTSATATTGVTTNPFGRRGNWRRPGRGVQGFTPHAQTTTGQSSYTGNGSGNYTITFQGIPFSFRTRIFGRLSNFR